jgi:hypothetical protein
MKPFIQHIFFNAMEMSESRKRLQLVVTPLIMMALLSSLGVSEILSSSQGVGRISSVELQAVSASLEEDSGIAGEETRPAEDNNQDGVQQDNNGGAGQSGEFDANTLDEETSPHELSPSPTSQDFLGRSPPQDNILNGGGGGNVIARDCPETGPIPPDCTINPFPPTPPKCPDKGPIPPDCTLNPFPFMPPLFGRNIPLQGGGIFGQQPAAIALPTPLPTPILTPEPPVPMFGSTQQQATPTPPTTGGEGLAGVAPRTVEPLTRTCPVGNVWDPNLMICVPDLPPLDLELCPDGSIPQSTGPGGIRPECPPFEAEQPFTTTPTKPPITPPTLRLCPDGSIPQSTGPGGIRPVCPPSETEQPQVEEQEEEP